MKKFVGDVGVVPFIHNPFEMFFDDEGVISLAQEPKSHQKTMDIN